MCVCARVCVCVCGGGGVKSQRFMKFCSLLKEAGRRGVCVCVGGGGGEVTKVYEILQSVKRGRQERVCRRGCVFFFLGGGATKVYEILQSVKRSRQERCVCVCVLAGGGEATKVMKFHSLFKEAGRRGCWGGGGGATKVYEILQSVKRGRQERVCRKGCVGEGV